MGMSKHEYENLSSISSDIADAIERLSERLEELEILIRRENNNALESLVDDFKYRAKNKMEEMMPEFEKIMRNNAKKAIEGAIYSEITVNMKTLIGQMGDKLASAIREVLRNV